MNPRGVRPRPRGTCRAGNPAVTPSLAAVGIQSCTSLHAWGHTSDCDCGQHHNLVSLTFHSGSRPSSPRGSGSYGPQRRKPPLKICGGSAPTSSSSQWDTPREAPTVQRYRSSADPHHGQQVLADLRRMQNIVHKRMNESATRHQMAHGECVHHLSGAHLHLAQSRWFQPLLR